MKAESIQSPLDDLAFDVVSVLHEKAQALEAYAKYLEDAEGDDELRELFEEMRRTDREHVVALKEALGRLLEDEDYEEGDVDIDDEDEEEDIQVESPGATASPPRRGESASRR